MSPSVSFGLKALTYLLLISVMMSTVCLLRAAILFTIAATLVAMLPLVIRISRIRIENAEARGSFI